MYRISVDTGGTFTDVVVTNDRGQLFIGKALTTPERSFTGLSAAIANAATQIGISFEELISKTRLLVYGTTRATNAIVERKTATTALLVTEGFPDTLIYRNGGKLNALQINAPVAPPFIPRRLTFEIPERINAEGGVERALDIDAARATLRKLADRKVEAVAVSLLWSIVNPVHERMLGDMIRDELPGVPYTLSSELNPIIREFPRTSSSAIDASLKPLMTAHLAAIRTDLNAVGFGGELLVSASSGGVMHIDDMAQKPIYMAKSGPAMAPLAGITYTRAEGMEKDDVIIVDTGGTTFDVSMIRAGTVKYTRDTWLGPVLTGTLLGMATVDIRSVGAGGGSIAWIDSGGLLRVGPRSAGSVPGPACYGRGGSEATVTDAAVALGYIDPDRFLGGRMKLDKSAAVAAIAPIARSIGKTVEETAAAILKLASETMIKAIEDITINDGVHPGDSVLVAGGGAAGLNILSIARSLNCKAVVIPKTAGAISASGGQFSDVAIDFSGSCYVSTAKFDMEKPQQLFADLAERASSFEADLATRGITRFVRRLFVQARYERQQFEMEIELPIGWIETMDPETLRSIYDAQCKRLYGFTRTDAPIEAITWRLRVVADLPGPDIAWKGVGKSHPDLRSATAYFDTHGLVETSVFDGTTIPLGTTIVGPAIIEEPTTTIVIDPGISGRLSDKGNYIFEFGGKNV